MQHAPVCSGNREIDENSMYMPIFKALITNIYVCALVSNMYVCASLSCVHIMYAGMRVSMLKARRHFATVLTVYIIYICYILYIPNEYVKPYAV